MELKLLHRKQAANFVGCHKTLIDSLRRAGKLKTFKTLGGRHMFYTDDLIKTFNMERNTNGHEITAH